MTRQRRTLLAVAALLAVTAIAAPIYRGEVWTPALEPLAPLSRALAAATAGTLELLGIAVVRDGATLRHESGFALEVTANCTAWLHVVLYLTGLFALRSRAGGGLGATRLAATGVAWILLVNLARLVLIFFVGVRAPALFDRSHHVAGEALLAGTVLLLWWRAARARPAPAPRFALRAG